MEYIRKKLERKISYLEDSGANETLKIYYQVRVEYLMIFCLGYLWNKNISNLQDDDKEYILSRIQKPSIGDVLDICRKLDVSGDFFTRKVAEKISKYPRIRNEKIGHGYVFEDGTEDYLSALKDIYSTFVNSQISIINSEFDLVLVSKLENEFYRGVTYKPDGFNYRPWSCSSKVQSFQIDNLYLYDNEDRYFRLSPFIEIRGEDEFYIFCSIQEPLLGKVKYNRILQTGLYNKEWPDFVEAEIVSAGNKRKSSNGTILNVFKNNYNKYIDIGIKKRITDFLTKTAHSVSATIWGHGGVGKTATIQHVCEELSQAYDKKFDYIIFLTAKDRFYNYHTGKIQEISESVSTVEEILININSVLFDRADSEIALLKEFQGKLLIIIDDYETLIEEEKLKVIDLIRSLNPNYHRLVVTTRADLKIGDEIPTGELNEKQTADFFIHLLENEFAAVPLEIFKSKINDTEYSKRLHFITSGRPIFIFQFAHTLIQKGDFDSALKKDIKESPEAINFLYGRIYEYLSNTAKDLFVAISLLVNDKDPSNLINKLKFILNLENNEEGFDRGLKELVKLRIIEVKENDFFVVYSKEILQKMNDYFLVRDERFRGNCKQRVLQISRDKKLDNENALLQNADSNRWTKNEEEVISSYRSILNRASSPVPIKLQAILNLSAYLVIDRGKVESAIAALKEYYHLFTYEPKYIKMYSTYHWTLGTDESRIEAINLLLEYCTQNKDLYKDVNLEIYGLLLTYRSIYNISRKDELKESIKYREISQSQFSQKNGEIKDEFLKIWKYLGHLYYDHLRKISLSSISSSARQNAVTGLYQLSEVLLRIGNSDKAKEMCEFVIRVFPISFHPIFISKLQKINRVIASEKPSRNSRR
jgi:GTPase SAR1 family protein